MSWHTLVLEKFGEIHPRRFFLQAWEEINDDAFGERSRAERSVDLRPLCVLLVAATVLILQEYLGAKADFRRLLSFVLSPSERRDFAFLVRDALLARTLGPRSPLWGVL